MSKYSWFFDGLLVDGQEVDTSKLEETGKIIIDGEEIDADDFVTSEDKMMHFDESAYKTKSDILFDIDYVLRDIEKEKHENAKHSEAYYDRYADLMRRFRSEVEKNVFPENLESGWHYTYEVEETGVTLSLSHAWSCDIDDNGSVDLLDTDAEFNIMHIKTKLLTVEQYAQAYGVTTTTVRQWIRRGKIRSALKAGSEWRIPELAEVRERGYQNASYHWEEYLTDFPEEYSFINDYSSAYIGQGKEQKNTYSVSFYGKDVPEKKMDMDQKEREKFELLLISNPFVKSWTSSITCRG